MIDTGAGTFFLSPSQLLLSPSSSHGIHPSSEKSLRIYSCEIIQEAGILLRMPQAVMATAQVLFHRFFFKRSFSEFDARSVAASCVWLAIKLEEAGSWSHVENRSRLPDVLNVFQRIRSRREGDAPVAPDSLGYKQRQKDLLTLESRILVELGFVCHVDHPHKLLLGYLKCLEASPELVQEAWNLVNDSLRTTLCVRFKSNVVACGVIYAAARRLGVALPQSPPWWLLFDTTFQQIQEVCSTLADLYRQPKAQYIEVRESILSKQIASVGTPETVCSDKKLEQTATGNVKEFCKNLSLLSPGSTSKLMNSCLMNAPGVPGFNGVFRGGFMVASKKPENVECGTKKYISADDKSLCRRSFHEGNSEFPKDGTRKRHREEHRDLDPGRKRYKDSPRRTEHRGRRKEVPKGRSGDSHYAEYISRDKERCSSRYGYHRQHQHRQRHG